MCIGMCVFSCHVDCFFFFFNKPIKYITPLNAIINSYMLNFGHACVCIAILLSYRRVGGKKTSELWCSFIILSQLVKRSILFLTEEMTTVKQQQESHGGLIQNKDNDCAVQCSTEKGPFINEFASVFCQTAST